MINILNLSLGSSMRDFECCFLFLGKNIFIKRVGLNGDTKRLLTYKIKKPFFDALTLGGINKAYSFEEKVWTLTQYHKIAKNFNIPIFDGEWVKKYYEPYALNNIINAFPDLVRNKWLVFSVLDRTGCYNLLKTKNIDVTIGDVLAALKIPVFPSHNMFRIGAQIFLPMFSKMSVQNFYPHNKTEMQKGNKAIEKFDVILSETNFILNRNFNDFKNKTLILSRGNAEEKSYLAKNNCKIHTLLPGEILSANMIEAMVGTTMGINNTHHQDMIFRAIDNIVRTSL